MLSTPHRVSARRQGAAAHLWGPRRCVCCFSQCGSNCTAMKEKAPAPQRCQRHRASYAAPIAA